MISTIIRSSVILVFIVFFSACSSDESKLCLEPESCPTPEYEFGFSKDHYTFEQFLIRPNQVLSDILLEQNIPYKTIYQIAEASKDVFDVRNFRPNKPYTFIYEDPCKSPDYMVYEPSQYRFVIYDLSNKSPRVRMVKRHVEYKTEFASGSIESSLWNAMVDINAPWSLISKMEDALAWSIDFHNVQVGDEFRLVYEREYIKDEPVGIGKLLGAYYKNNNEYYSIYYEGSKYPGYFDENGRSMQRAFLKSPVKYSVISSAYNLRRRHPILKRIKPHLGTDYAAPYGTPILSVADGVVTQASRTRGNGNYVKVKHDKIYTTQYLHMQKFAPGIKPGIHVKQGQVIGYVGSTGLATGPHVCFRFWKNGKQVDHRREKLPPPEPMAEEDLEDYMKVRDEIMSKLEGVPMAEDIEQNDEGDLEKIEIPVSEI